MRSARHPRELCDSPEVPAALSHAYFKSASTGLWLHWTQLFPPPGRKHAFNVINLNSAMASTALTGVLGMLRPLQDAGGVVYSFDFQGLGGSFGARGHY